MRLTYLALFALVGCTTVTDNDPNTSDVAATGEASGDSGSATSSDDAADSDSSDGATDATTTESTGTAKIDWSDVPCEKMTCSGTEVCVQPGIDCDYSPCDEGGMAQWVMGPSRCEPFVAECDPADPANCLSQEYCQNWEFADFEAGLLECGHIAKDCFCF